ncbi:hypothetical protein E4U21_006864 [Claviceps maximensis]|nr:hypothetical protein E4U21_006864 [Claviceps maximensis]
MATPELAIAKAALSAALFRADPTSISRPSVDSFFQLLNSILSQCSRPNVQNCKDYITNNIALSGGRVTALGKYLVALSKAQVDNGTNAIRPSSKRRRLHILYLANDTLHHHHHQNDLSSAWEPFLPALFASAAAYDKCPKHIHKLEDLIGLWKERRYVSEDTIAKLREAISNDGGSGSGATPFAKASNNNNNNNDDDGTSKTSSSALKLAREMPYLLPSYHGDPSTAWYDLPAATWLPQLVPNSTKPMLPELIKPIQLAPGPADNAITAAVKALVLDAERIFSKGNLLEEGGLVDINELGERIILDEITGDIVGGETYYGWSRQFCERMKHRKKGNGPRRRSLSQSPSRSRSRSRSRSGSRFSSRDRNYSRGRQRRSSSRSIKRRRLSPSSRSRSRSRGRGRSRSRTRTRSRSRSRTRDRSRARTYSPSRSPSHSCRARSLSRSPIREQPNRNQPQPLSPIPPSMPIPPPPAGYNGPWPPPPPPLPIPPPSASHPTNFLAAPPPQGWIPDPAFAAQFMGAWNSGQMPPLPLPLPQQHQHYQQPNFNHHNTRGSDNGGYRGRGGGRGFHRGGGGYGRGK